MVSRGDNKKKNKVVKITSRVTCKFRHEAPRDCETPSTAKLGRYLPQYPPILRLFYDCIPKSNRCLCSPLKLLPSGKVHGLGQTGDDVRVKGLWQDD